MMPRPTQQQEAEIKRLLADGLSVYRICQQLDISRYHVRVVRAGRKKKKKAEAEPTPNVVICAKIFARTPRGKQLREGEGDLADLDLPPDIAELARRIREEGFAGERKAHHEPWGDDEYQRRAVEKSEPTEVAETSIHFYPK